VVYFGTPGGVQAGAVRTRSLDEIKRAFFGQADKDARELVFHYTVLADFASLNNVVGKAVQVGVASAGARTVTLTAAVSAKVAVGQPLIVSAGAGAGQLRFVTAVSANRRVLTVDADWTVRPDRTSKVASPSGSSGQGEVDWRPHPDYGPFPGNDFLVTLGGFDGPLGTFAQQWRTFAHEVGHNFGLRHHGVNHSPNNDPKYHSLMSYAYQLRDPSDVNSYSGASDAVFDDWSNLRLDFSTAFNHLGNSFNIGARQEPEVRTQGPAAVAVKPAAGDPAARARGRLAVVLSPLLRRDGLA